MRKFLLSGLIAALPIAFVGCENAVPTGPGKVTITETTTSTSTTSTTTTTIPIPPTSKFLFSPISPVAGVDRVFFDGSDSTAAPGRRIVNYDWNFGDGNTGDGPTPDHLYATPGIYIISLIIEDDAGGSARSTQPIQVR